MPRSIIALALLAGCNYDYAFLGWSEQTVSEPPAVDEPDPAAIAAADTGDLPPEHTDEVVLSEEDTDTYSGDTGGTDTGELSTDTDTGELPEDTDPPLDTDGPLDTGSPPDSDPPTDVWVDTDPPVDTDLPIDTDVPPPPPEVPVGCRITVGVDGYTETYEPGETFLVGGYFTSVADSVGVTSARAGWDNPSITTPTVTYDNTFDSPAGWAWSSGCAGGVSWTEGRAVSLSDWAFIQETTTSFSTSEEVLLEMDTNWSTSSNTIGLGISSTPGPISAGSCGYGPPTPLLAVLTNGLYAGGAATARLDLYVRRPDGTTEIIKDTTYPVPLPGSGDHHLTLLIEGCE